MNDQPTSDTLVFVYGTLKNGCALNHRMADIDATFVGPASIMAKNYVMRDLGGFPALQKVETGSGTYIKGEVWLVDPAGLGVLDAIESYPEFYCRERTKCWIGDESFTAFVYYIDHTDPAKEYIWHMPVIKSGEWGIDGPLEDNGNPTAPIALGYQGSICMAGCEDSEEETEEEEIEEVYRTSFTVEKGVYITSDWGEHYGPFASVKEAVQKISTLIDNGVVDEVKSLTIGFRMMNDSLTDEELIELDTSTFPF